MQLFRREYLSFPYGVICHGIPCRAFALVARLYIAFEVMILVNEKGAVCIGLFLFPISSSPVSPDSVVPSSRGRLQLSALAFFQRCDR
jgi:hypothetical protein